MRVTDISFLSATADAESGPNLILSPGECRLRYTDYQNIEHEYLFSDVVQVSYDPSSHPKYRGLSDDGQYEVHDSDEIASLRIAGEIPDDKAFYHYLFGFNEHGGIFISVVTGTQGPSLTNRSTGSGNV